MREIPLSDRVKGYASSVYPEWDDEVLSDQLVSWGLFHRDAIHDELHKLSPEQVEIVRGTDLAMIEHAPEIAEWCDIDGRWGEREDCAAEWNITHDKWWWWLDEIAAGTYPLELLPDYLREAAVEYRNQG